MARIYGILEIQVACEALRTNGISPEAAQTAGRIIATGLAEIEAEHERANRPAESAPETADDRMHYKAQDQAYAHQQALVQQAQVAAYCQAQAQTSGLLVNQLQAAQVCKPSKPSKR